MAKFFQLEDVKELAKNHPDTFIIPPIDERKSQRVGNSVRLHFKIKNPADGEPQAERMWVTITQTPGFFRSYKSFFGERSSLHEHRVSVRETEQRGALESDHRLESAGIKHGLTMKGERSQLKILYPS
jgi:hypothetical protein